MEGGSCLSFSCFGKFNTSNNYAKGLSLRASFGLRPKPELNPYKPSLSVAALIRFCAEPEISDTKPTGNAVLGSRELRA